ncbi:DNA mismatch repair protein MutH, partial [Vibrio fluvialis]|nr:DNA mismatch repair protein MutH [Vibrio fluvialis]
MKPEPQSEQELLERAQLIAGANFADLASEAEMTVP